jgi:hypothetical protein
MQENEMSPYLIVQKNERKAKRLTTLGIWLMVIGFGAFMIIAWSGSNESLLTGLAMLGLLAGIIGIKVSITGRDLKRTTNRTFNALVLANARYKNMKEDSSSLAYKNTIKHLFKKG